MLGTNAPMTQKLLITLLQMVLAPGAPARGLSSAFLEYFRAEPSMTSGFIQ